MTRCLLTVLLAMPALLPGQSSSGNCAKPFEAALQSARDTAIDARSGDIEITGSRRSGLRVTCEMSDADRAAEVRISFAAGHLRIYGGPNNLHLRIQLPERSNLLVRSPAGDLNISGVTGDKDVELRAGDLTIMVGAPESYRVAEGSVLAGDLVAPAFGVTKDGLFRSFRKENATGQFRLRAHLLAGDLVLK